MNQRNKNDVTEPNKSSREIEGEIAQTRGAISEDIKALGDRLNPASLKHEVKDVAMGALGEVKADAVDKIVEAKDSALAMAIEVKDATIDKAVELKDAAVEVAHQVKDATAETLHEVQHAVGDTMHAVGDNAARAGRATWRFSVANAAPLAMIGVGSGWMIANVRAGRSNGSGDRYPVAPMSTTMPNGLPSSGHLPHARAHRASSGASMGMARRARDASRDFVDDNPMAIAFATLAVGVGVGLLLPRTAREDKLLGPAREKVEQLVDEARDAALGVGEVAKEAARETAHALG